MLRLKNDELEQAAEVFAESFVSDPAFSLVLQGIERKQGVLKEYFLNYISKCKDVLLYKSNEQGAGYLCFYCSDAVFPDFDVPAPLEKLEKFQHIDELYDRNYAVLDILAVKQQFRGQGVAGKLIDFFVAESKKRGLLPLVEVFSVHHLDLYFAHGFREKHRFVTDNITTIILEYDQ